MEPQGMYGERAALYDLIYHWKDYAGDTEKLAALLADRGVADGSSVLEAACGTGSYLVHLAERYRVTGLDLHDAMLEVARAKLGDDVPLIRGDMSDFRLDAPMHAILCLFSSIGYLHGDRLPAAARAFHENLRPGGVAIVEPWFPPEEIRDRSPHVHVYRSDEICLARLCTTVLDGRVSRMDFHWLVATPSGVEHFEDLHAMWCATRGELESAFTGAGFAVEWAEPFDAQRGLLVATRAT